MLVPKKFTVMADKTERANSRKKCLTNRNLISNSRRKAFRLQKITNNLRIYFTIINNDTLLPASIDYICSRFIWTFLVFSGLLTFLNAFKLFANKFFNSNKN